jgi:RHS repeat-associated protein
LPEDCAVIVRELECIFGLVQSSGAPTALYEYSRFGELIRSTGPASRLNPFQFSTKYLDQETGLSYYGHRYYSASLGRWISRDPVEEEDGPNVYAFISNRPLTLFDAFGLTAGSVADTTAGTGGATAVGAASAQQAITILNQVKNAVETFNDIQEITTLLLDEFDEDAEFDEMFFVQNLAKQSLVAGFRGGETSATQFGREIHKVFYDRNNYLINFGLKNGKRVDAVNLVKRIVRELKPHNKRAIARGTKQLASYLKQLKKEYGGEWKGFLDTYVRK